MAAAYVAGLAALVASLNSDLSGREIKQLIMDNVQKKYKYFGLVSSGGLIDVEKTIKAAKASSPPPPPCTGSCKNDK